MKRLVRLAAWLYPAAWRARYGSEFGALLEDVKPGGRDVWDVLRGAFMMRMMAWNFGRITGLCALAGVIVAGALAYMKPAEYVSTAVLRIAPAALPDGTEPAYARAMMAGHLQRLQMEVLSRRSLAEIILRPALDLYQKDRAQYPLEDIVRDMRQHAIRIQPVTPVGGSGSPARAFAISYTYPNKFKAQAVVRELVTRFIEQNVTQQRQGNADSTLAGGVADLEVLDPANLPDKPSSPNWPKVLMWGLIAGLLLGVVTASVLTQPAARTLKTAGAGIAGFVAVAALSWLIPNQYVSTTVLRTGRGALPIEQLLDSDLLARVVAAQTNGTGGREVQSVEALRQHLAIRVVSPPDPDARVFTISFQSTNPSVAQWVVREVVGQASQKQRLAAGGGKPWMPGTLVPPPAPALQVLDPASNPAKSSYPNRLAMSAAGLVAGLILGAWFLRPRSAAAQA
jgi:LPS O-antigen subunit length determinant protein (WzzB/FepE family)